MADEKLSIPVVDFSVMGLCNDEIPSDSDVRVQEIASQICKAFSNIGFVYLNNHGIPEEEVGSQAKALKKL